MNTAIDFFTQDNAYDAADLARTQQKPLLIDFWATNCKGCQKMEDVTYEDVSVQEYLAENYVSVKSHVSKINHEFSKRFLTTALIWTPSFYIYSPDGTIVRTIIGYQSPRRFISEISMGMAFAHMRQRQFGKAIDLLTHLPAKADLPELDQEAMYWAGVASFFQNNKDANALLPYWGELRQTYPGSGWADKADLFPGLM